MSTVSIDQLIEGARTLPFDKQKQLRDTLNDWLNQPRITEAEFEQQLLKQGLLQQLPAPITDFSPYQNRHPIQVTGQPLSETIIEDRGE